MSSFVEPHELLWTEVVGIADAEGLSLYDLERGGGGLRVFVEANKKAEDKSEDAAENITSDPDVACEGQAGVTSGDCSRLCRRLMFFFSVEGARLGVGSEPSIEVSSPGINRRLRLPWHFRSALGKEVKVTGLAETSNTGVASGAAALTGVQTNTSLQTITGRLAELRGEDGLRGEDDANQCHSIVLATEKGGTIVFPFASIQKARVEFTF